MVTQYRAQASPQLRQYSSRSNFQPKKVSTTATDILGALQGFADVAGGAAKEYMDEEVAKDKLVQTERAWRGEELTDNATKGGQKAAQAVSAHLASAKGRARLATIAQEDLSDDEWEAAIKEEWDSVKTEAVSKYGDSEEISKALTLEMQNAMPSLSATREKVGLEREVNKRKEDLADTFAVLANQDPASLPLMLKSATTSLQLTDEQTEEALLSAIDQTGSLELIELTKTMKNKQGHSFYDKTASLQKKEKQLKAENARQDAATSLAAVERMNNQYLSGDLSREEYEGQVSIMKEETGGAYPTQGMIESINKKATKAHATQEEKYNTSLALDESTGAFVNTKLVAKEQQALLDDRFNAYMEEDGMTEDVALRRAIADANKMATTYKTVEKKLEAFVNVNVDANTVTEGDVVSFNEQIDSFAQTVENFPPEEIANYGNSKTVKILNNYHRGRESGLSPSQALKQAQVQYRNADKQDPVVLNEVTKTIVGDFDTNWLWGLGTTVSDGQNAYISRLVREQLAFHPDPSTDHATSTVEKWMESNTTAVGDKLLRGAPAKLASMIGVNEDHIEKYHEGAINAVAPQIKLQLEGTDFDVNDAWLEFDQRTGMAHVHYPHMQSNISFPANEIKDMYKESKKKKKNEVKEASEKFKKRDAKLNSEKRNKIASPWSNFY